MGMEPLDFGGVLVGDGHPPVFMAELGTFFNQDVMLAQRQIRSAAQAGVRLIKSEVLHDAELCLKGTGLKHAYQHAKGTAIEDYRRLVERKVLSLDQYRRIFETCHEQQVPFVASVYDFKGVDFLAEIGCAGIKISRDKVDNLALIRHAASTGLPLIIDIGEISLADAARAVSTARQAGSGGVMVNHHPGSEPAPAKRHNLSSIELLKKALGAWVGLSCHYRGNLMLYLAAACGANLLEKGVAEDPKIKEQAIIACCSMDEVHEILEKLEETWLSLGDGALRQEPSKDFDSAQCLVASRTIKAGEVLDAGNLSFAWPPLGISAGHWDLVVGKKAARGLDPHTPLQWEDLGL